MTVVTVPETPSADGDREGLKSQRRHPRWWLWLALLGIVGAAVTVIALRSDGPSQRELLLGDKADDTSPAAVYDVFGYDAFPAYRYVVEVKRGDIKATERRADTFTFVTFEATNFRQVSGIDDAQANATDVKFIEQVGNGISQESMLSQVSDDEMLWLGLYWNSVQSSLQLTSAYRTDPNGDLHQYTLALAAESRPSQADLDQNRRLHAVAEALGLSPQDVVKSQLETKRDDIAKYHRLASESDAAQEAAGAQASVEDWRQRDPRLRDLQDQASVPDDVKAQLVERPVVVQLTTEPSQRLVVMIRNSVGIGIALETDGILASPNSASAVYAFTPSDGDWEIVVIAVDTLAKTDARSARVLGTVANAEWSENYGVLITIDGVDTEASGGSVKASPLTQEEFSTY